MFDMLRSIKRLSGEDVKKLTLPIILTIIDTMLSMSMIGMLVTSLILLAAGTFDHKSLMLCTVILIIAFLLRCIIYSNGYVLSQIRGSEISSQLRISFANHIRSLSLGYFNKNSIGILNSAMTTNISDFESILTHSLCDLVKVVVYALFSLVFALIVNLPFALIILVFVAVSVPLLDMGGKMATKQSEKVRESTSEVISRTMEYVSGIKTFRLYHLTGEKFRRLDHSFNELRKRSIGLELGLMPYNISYSLIISLLIPISLIAGSLFVGQGQLDRSTYIVLVMLVTSISGTMSSLASLYTGMKFSNKASANLISILDEKPLSYKKGAAVFSDYGITLEHVSFQYTKDIDVLSDITFQVPPGTITALIGPSGSGKSTVASLILRFWDVTKGKISVGGEDIRNMKPDTLTEHMAVVFQDVYLINDTIFNNIRLGRPTATNEDVIKAAKAAHCHDFILAMENGYDTIVGEGGSSLSGGEKQRISIARAFVKDAPIILLDESTSSLDADNEAEINNALDTLMKNKTVIVIAHRLNTIINADNIIVLDHGKIRESGNHHTLLEKGGWYAQMYTEQQKATEWIAG